MRKIIEIFEGKILKYIHRLIDAQYFSINFTLVQCNVGLWPWLEFLTQELYPVSFFSFGMEISELFFLTHLHLFAHPCLIPSSLLHAYTQFPDLSLVYNFIFSVKPRLFELLLFLITKARRVKKLHEQWHSKQLSFRWVICISFLGKATVIWDVKNHCE